MMIREASRNDGKGLQDIQTRCTAGNTLKIVTVNEPDYFSRTGAYKECRVFVACENQRILGSVACAILKTTVGGQPVKAGYIFQAFVEPQFRGQGIVRKLYEHCEQFLLSQHVPIGFGLIMQDNQANRRAAGRTGYDACKGPRIEYLLTYRKMPVESAPKRIRAMTVDDAGAVCDLLNGMWNDYDLYEPMTVEKLLSDVRTIPEFGLDNILVVEAKGKVVACATYWDWSKITKITVKSWNTRLKLTAAALALARVFRKAPVLARPGNILKQWCLINFAFSSIEDFKLLLMHINNLAVDANIDQVCFVCNDGHKAIKDLTGFIRLGFDSMLYVKSFGARINLKSSHIWISGLGL
jgi:N-acetylglutamate synthase-like GNAT family acetyltransferase